MRSYFRQSRLFFVFLGLMIAVLFHALPGAAQSSQGTILGTVKDAKGAVIPDATVTLTNVATGTVRTAKTNSTGDYQFLDAVASTYRVEVTATGFENSIQDNVVLTAQAELRVDATLNVGRATQTVTVNGAALGVIETDTPQISGIMTGQDLLDLPTNTRASGNGTSPFYALQAMSNINWNYQQSSGSAVYHWTSIAGSNTFQTIVQMDGITNMSTAANHPQGDLIPSADAISEIDSDGMLSDAEHSSPAEISFISKSGTNNFHGGLWWYHQDSGLNATPYGSLIKPHMVGNTFGGKLGGPVVIPHLYDGHNKSFFFFDYEGFRFPRQSTFDSTVPTQAMMQGDFTNYVIPDQNGNNTFQGLINPATGKTCGYTFAVCGFQINPIAQQFMKFYPTPNTTPKLNLANGSTMAVPETEFVEGESDNYVVNKDTGTQSNEVNVRVDQYFGANQKFLLWGRFMQKNAPTNAPEGMLLPSETNVEPNRYFLVSGNYSITPNLVDEARFAYSNEYFGYDSAFDGKSFSQNLGFNPALVDLWYNALPYVGLSQFSSINSERFNWGWGNTAWVYNDSLSWVKGTHTFKFGAQLQHLSEINPNSDSQQYGTFDFSNSANGNVFTGVDWADFLLGIPQTTSFQNVTADNFLVQTSQDYYGQDQWHLNRRTTLTYGIRYEFNPGWSDVNGMIGNIDPNVPGTAEFLYPTGHASSLASTWLASLNACDPDGIHNTNAAIVNGVGCIPVVGNKAAGLPASLRRETKDRFMPRIGVAYRLTNDNKWVVRAGYGMYNNYISAESQANEEPMMLQSASVSFINGYKGGGTSGTPLIQWPNTQIGTGNENVTSPGHYSPYWNQDPRHFTDPYTEQWTLTLGHDFGNGFGGRISYIGSASHHMEWEVDRQIWGYSTTPRYYQPITSRVFPNLGRVGTYSTTANASYNGLQAELKHNMQNGFSFDSIFTWAKDMADNQGSNGEEADENAGGAGTYYYDRHLDWGAVNGLRPVNSKTSFIYHLPIGRGQAIGDGMSRILDLFVGGWNLSSLIDYQSGMRLTAEMGGGSDPSGTGTGECGTVGNAYNTTCNNQQPDIVPGVSRKAAHPSPTQWLNPAAYTCPGDPNWQFGYSCHTGAGPAYSAINPATGQSERGMELINGQLYTIPNPIGRFGTSRVGGLIGPQFFTWDAGVFKVFSLTERVKLRAEGTFTNVTNNGNLDPTTMNTNITSRSYGEMTSAIAARNGQVSLRLDF